MTLPPFDGPRARQATTATLTGTDATGAKGAKGLPVEGAALPEAAGHAPVSPLPPTSPATPATLVAPPGYPGSSGEPPSPPGSAAPQGAAPATQRGRWADGEPEPLNLARRPFVNVRPVERLAIILWVLGVVLLAANVTLFMGYLTSSQSTRAKLAGLEREVAQEQRDGAVLQGSLGKLGLDQQNREVTFLNRKIDERTFSWSLLFDRMAEVLPDQVRLLRLRPSNVVQREIGLGPRPSARELNPPPVTLTMHCEAKDDEAVLRFVDNLFAHPAFSNPNLETEERQDNGWLRFDITVQYQTNVPAGATSRPPQARASRQTRRPTNATGAAGKAAAALGGAAGTAGFSGLSGRAGGAPGAGTGRNPAAGGAVPGAPPAPTSPAGAGLVPVGPPPVPRPGSRVPRPPSGSLAPPAPSSPTGSAAPAPVPPRPPLRKGNPFAPGISAASGATGNPPEGGR